MNERDWKERLAIYHAEFWYQTFLRLAFVVASVFLIAYDPRLAVIVFFGVVAQMLSRSRFW